MFTCNVCKKQFDTQNGVNSHKIVHNLYKQSNKIIKWQATVNITKAHTKNQKIKEYNKCPKLCTNCNLPLTYIQFKLNYKCCSRSCAAYISNIPRKKQIVPHLPKLPKPLNTYTCKYCKKIGKTTYKNKMYCNGSCRNKITNLEKRGSRSKAEKYLQDQLNCHFPQWEIHYNDRKILNGLELDVYIPHIKLGIEWNGIFHFLNIHKDSNFNKIINKDQEKIIRCQNLGITLMVICDRTSHIKFIKETVSSIINQLKCLI